MELDRILDVHSIAVAEFTSWWNSGRDVRCAHKNDTSFTGTQAVLPVFDDKKRISLNDALTAVKDVNWNRPSFPVPWYAAARQGLLLKNLTHGLRAKSKWDVEQSFAEGVGLTWNADLNKCSQLQVIKAATKLFEAYPVMLLMWGGDPIKTPITYASIVKRRSEIEKAFALDVTVQKFFQGGHIDFVAFAYFKRV